MSADLKKVDKLAFFALNLLVIKYSKENDPGLPSEIREMQSTPSIILSLSCLSVPGKIILGQFTQVVACSEKHGINEIATFRLTGLVLVNFCRSLFLPV